jgi:hypothetical protein
MATTLTSGLTRRTYRILVYGIVGTGVLGLLVGLLTGRHLAGTAVYLLGAWVGGGVALLAPRVSDANLQDERDHELHNRASGMTMGVTMTVGLAVVPALYVLDAGGRLEITGALGGAVSLASALFVLYGVCFGLVTRRN